MKKQILFLLLGAVFLMASCKREESVLERGINYTGPIMVSFNNYETAEGNVSYVRSELVFKDSLQEVNVEVKLVNTTGTAPSDILVYLTKVDAIVSNYNTSNGSALTPVSNTDPAVQYDFSKPVVIRQGTRRTTINLRVNPVKLTQANAIGIGILRVEGAGATINSTSQSKVVIEFSARNQYDGSYTLKGAFYHPTQSPGYDRFTTDMEMHTSGSNSVKLFWPDAGVFAQPGLFLGVLSYFGVQEPEFTVDPATNKVTVQNTAPGAVTFYMMAPGYNSRWDPATKTIYAKYGYNYNPGPVFNPATNREWTDTLIYQGPR